MPDNAPQQLLHLVIGGELVDLEHNTFKDLDQVEKSVDNAHMRYFIVHLHRLLDPAQDTKSGR